MESLIHVGLCALMFLSLESLVKAESPPLLPSPAMLTTSERLKTNSTTTNSTISAPSNSTASTTNSANTTITSSNATDMTVEPHLDPPSSQKEPLDADTSVDVSAFTPSPNYTTGLENVTEESLSHSDNHTVPTHTPIPPSSTSALSTTSPTHSHPISSTSHTPPRSITSLAPPPYHPKTHPATSTSSLPAKTPPTKAEPTSSLASSVSSRSEAGGVPSNKPTSPPVPQDTSAPEPQTSSLEKAQPSSTPNSSPPAQAKANADSPPHLNVGDEAEADPVSDTPTLDPLLAGLVSAFIVTAVIITLLVFIKFRRRDTRPEFRRLQDLPMDDMMEDTPLSMYNY